jgi:hypothetical protein
MVHVAIRRHFIYAIGLLLVCRLMGTLSFALADAGSGPDAISSPSSKVDPEAQYLMEKMFAAYQNLKSYSGRMERSEETEEEKLPT